MTQMQLPAVKNMTCELKPQALSAVPAASCPPRAGHSATSQGPRPRNTGTPHVPGSVTSSPKRGDPPVPGSVTVFRDPRVPLQGQRAADHDHDHDHDLGRGWAPCV